MARKSAFKLNYTAPLLAFLVSKGRPGRPLSKDSVKAQLKQNQEYLDLLKAISGLRLETGSRLTCRRIGISLTKPGKPYHRKNPDHIRMRVAQALDRLVKDLEIGFPSGRGANGWNRDRAIDFLRGKIVAGQIK